MFKKILIANRGDNAAGVAAKGDFARAKSAVATLRDLRSKLSD
jgi:acetyl/propionyl-CoA carboxylase alpha subunit